MSLENEIQSSPDKAAVPLFESKKHLKFSYTRDFLLSLSELDVCKKLPSGFDLSVLSEFADASSGIQDRGRIPGSLPSQSYRRTEYSSSPPTKGDSSNYSRGIYGKWDHHFSGRSERDKESKSDWDSESGRHHSNQSRQSGQSPEHDGLLGSGSFPKPSGNAAGLSAPKVQPNDIHQLNRSNEPYHPPRPYKAVPHLRRGTTDLYNDETFGSTESTSQDKAEEERRRRESFELMRKEQQKALQEKQKLNPDKRKDGYVSDVTELLEDSKGGKRFFNRSNELDDTVTQPVLNNDSTKSSSQTYGSRPLVPPGFKSAIVERNSSARSVAHSNPTEVVTSEIEQSLSHAKAVVQSGTLHSQEERQSAQKRGFRELHENTSIHTPSVHKGEQIEDSSADLEVSYTKLGMDNQLYRTSSLSEASETQDGSESVEFDTKKSTGLKSIGDSKQDLSTTLLQKLFGSASKVNLSGSSGFIEHHNTERDDSPNAVQSSKFAQWFLEDETAAVGNPPQARSSDLLSLIVGREKVGSQVSDATASEHIPPALSFQSSELTSSHFASNATSSTFGTSEQFDNCTKQEAVPGILTCEDLEQTILSGYSESSSTLQAPVQEWSFSGAETNESKEDIDDLASQHLISLLHKGAGLINNRESLNQDGGSSGIPHVSKGEIVGSELGNSREEKAANIHQSGKTLTLETLFGSAFMKELQSVGAPVSVQKGSAEPTGIDMSEPHRSSFGVVGGDSLFPTSTVEIGSSRSGHGINLLQSTQRQQSKSDKVENWFTQVEVDPSNHNHDVVSRLGGVDRAVDIQFPEEGSLITVGDPASTLNSMFVSAPNSNKGELELLYSHKPANIVEKLATLNTVFKDERPMVVGQEGQPFVHGPYEPMEHEIQLRNTHAQPLSPRFQPPQMNHGRPFFRPVDSYTNVSSQMNFLDHDTTANQQFPANMLRPPFHHPNTRPAGFDRPQHSMLRQMPMQMPGNIPPPHLLQEFPRGGLRPPHSSNHATGFTQAHNHAQGLPFGHQQSNFGGPGIPLQTPDFGGGSNHPEVFQRLLEMERRANSRKTTHPFAAIGHTQGMNGHDLDMGFRYR